MNLLTAIQSYPGKTAQEVLDLFSADAVVSTNSVSQSLAGVADALALQGVDAMVLIDLRAHIRTFPIGGDTLEGLLLTGGGSAGGVDFSLASIRYQLGANQQHPSTTAEQHAILAGMLLIGVRLGQQWQKVGLGALPTVEEIEAAIDTQATADWISRVRDVINAAVGTSATISQLKTTIAGL